MPRLDEESAGRYARAVHQVLVEEFPRLKDRTLELLVLEQIKWNAEFPSLRFELAVDDPKTANWRLVPDATGQDRWRVQLACWKQRPSHANARREQRINTALRAIRLED